MILLNVSLDEVTGQESSRSRLSKRFLEVEEEQNKPLHLNTVVISIGLAPVNIESGIVKPVYSDCPRETQKVVDRWSL